MSQHRSLRGRVLHPFSRTEIREFEALQDVSFNVAEGEFFGIVGRNGSGKSTLLKILAGIYRADTGGVTTSGSLAPFIELGVGFNFELSARDNVFLNGALLGLSKRQLRDRYEHIVAFAELEEFMELKLANFSSGMQVRLAFAIAVESDADILLIDEVLAVGDQRFQRKCFDVFQARKDAGRTVVFVSHDMGAVKQFCDRVVLLEKGVKVAEGTARQVADAYYALNRPERAQRAVVSDDSWIDQIAVSPGTLQDDASNVITVDHGKRLTASIRIDPQTNIERAAIGFIVSDERGRSMIATSTSYMDGAAPSLRVGQPQLVEFAFDNMLGAGTYYLSTTVENLETGDLLDFRRDGLEFNVVSVRPTGALIEVPHAILMSAAPPVSG